MNLNKEQRYLPFLSAIPIVLIGMFWGGKSPIDFQMHDTYVVIAKFHVAILFLIILAIKSGLYYLSQEVSFVSFFYKSDVVLTLMLVCIGLYYIIFTQYNPVTPDAVALMTLVFASWILIQLLVGANYLTLMFFGEE